MAKFHTNSGRLEAFSDGVLAVIITIMVLGLRPPRESDLRSVLQILPSVSIYALSFIFIGIYWNNHHHMLRASMGIDGRAMWANLHLLFWLSLVPFATEWLGEHPTAVGPTVLYALILLLDALAYTLLKNSLVRVNGNNTPFARAVAVDVKGRVSTALYVVAIASAFISTIVSDASLITAAALWLVPDRRFENLIARESSANP